MAGCSFRFDQFVLDPADRTLRRQGTPVEINARYLDALILLVRTAGTLVEKERFLQEVWRGVPVTDEALTQCIRTLRRQLGDDATRPRFIETVPKHGYRFIALVDRTDGAEMLPAAHGDWRRFLSIAGAGTIGGAVAGVVGGLLYGAVGASQQSGSGAGGASVLMVLLWLSIAVALVGGAGVSLGIAAARFARAAVWQIVGGATGGLLVGGSAKLLGLDAFQLLLGRSPAGVTGAPEGMLLGAAVGAGAWLARRADASVPFSRRLTRAGVAGGLGGAAVVALGGQMMAGSLDLLAGTFPASRLRVDLFSSALAGLGPIMTGALEGALFAACIVGAMILAERRPQES